jgi:hypothetical protein
MSPQRCATPPRGRGQGARAIAVRPRGHGRRLGLGAGGVRRAPGRWRPRDPCPASLRERVPGVLARGGAIRHRIGGSIGGVQRGQVCLEDRAEGGGIAALAAQWCQEHGTPRVMRDHPSEPGVMEGGPLRPTLATRDGHDLFIRGVVAVIAAIDMDADRRAMHPRRPWPPSDGSVRGRPPQRAYRTPGQAHQHGDAWLRSTGEPGVARSVCPGNTATPASVVGAPSRGR